MAGQVDVWLGRAADEQSFEAFFEETYSEDDAPISAFAVSQGVTFYDHDFIDRVLADACLSLDEAFKGVSYGSSFIEEVRAKMGEFDYNMVVTCYSDDFFTPRSVKADGIELEYIGRFAYDKTAGPVGNYDHLGHIYIHVLADVKLEFEGELTDCIRVDAMGLMIGKVNPYARSLDISSIVPDVDMNQLRISVNAEGIWELRDFGNNGLSRLGLDSFDNERSMPWPGIKFSVGALEFMWSDGPK
ncbi:MAG: immunity 22 family protein [Armatimonadota bacterium]